MVQILHTNGQFTGLPHEDPQIHLRTFIEITNTYIPIGVSSDYDKPRYRDIRHILCGVDSNARWERSKLVDVTRTKALDTSHGHVLSSQERQARDDSAMVRMFGMAELQLRIGGHPVTDAEMETMAERYPLTESAAFLCRTGPAFLEPLDNNEATADEAMDDEDDDVVDAEANALMVFDHDDDQA
uniref:Uncharacterized protein n=1 Tax=Solanum tuberosum TaxID=4113 RepID=M1D8E9_SOLTU